MLKYWTRWKSGLKQRPNRNEPICFFFTFFLKAQEIFTEAEHLFKIDIKKAKVARIKLELEEKEQEMKHILEQFLQFVVAYERIFKQALEGLKWKCKPRPKVFFYYSSNTLIYTPLTF